MLVNQLINKKVIVIKLKCKINSELQYYSNQVGLIKGIRKINSNIFIYLIEFLNHNRIWVMKQEFKFYYEEY